MLKNLEINLRDGACMLFPIMSNFLPWNIFHEKTNKIPGKHGDFQTKTWSRKTLSWIEIHRGVLYFQEA
jgi:hypothetical protein